MHCIRMGYAKLDQTAPLEYSIRMDTWSDLLFYEMSFLGCDIMILLYLIILVRTAMSQNLTLNLAIQAANWTVGIVLGLAGAVSTLVGAQNMLQYRGWEVLASLVVGILLCFLAYSMAVIIQEVWVERRSTQDKEKVRDSSYVAVQIV